MKAYIDRIIVVADKTTAVLRMERSFDEGMAMKLREPINGIAMIVKSR
tara:strand:- start:497 stop:640 length:144 start_codon:yes stop_codon:yes gene_type:complete